MSTQNPTIAIVYQKNVPEQKIQAHWRVAIDGLEEKHFFLRPDQHKRQARRYAFAEALTWIRLSYPYFRLYKTGPGTFSNSGDPASEIDLTDWQVVSQEPELEPELVN
jgi:hypothetical protein